MTRCTCLGCLIIRGNLLLLSHPSTYAAGLSIALNLPGPDTLDRYIENGKKSA